jgi:predicted Zn finger-like uncharacterized protein
MYTQCPECQIAFRVTAKVLQQAAGNVRCGNCEHAFNALEYLSEEMPEPVPPHDAESDHDDLAETSRRLLETLDELAGPDAVRIEDTGVEWRVLDTDSAGSAGPFVDERRYDDNSPLPDDYDDDAPYQAPPQRRESDRQPIAEMIDDRQGDLALSDPEDWTDILEEVRDPDAVAFGIEEELAAIHNEMTPREPAGDEPPADIDSQFDTQAEALGLILPGADDAMTDEVPHLDESGVVVDSVDDDSLIEAVEALAAEEDEAELASSPPEDDVDTGVFEQPLDEDALDVEEESQVLDERESTGEFQSGIDVAAEALASEEFEAFIEADDEPAVDSLTVDDDAVEALADEIDPEQGVDEPDAAGPDVEAALSGAVDVQDWLDETVESSSSAEEETPDAEPEQAVPDDAGEEERDEGSDVQALLDEEEETSASADDPKDFTATLVGMENPEELFDESSGEVETIIMEGEFIRTEIEKERIAAKNAARNELDDPARLLDTYAMNRKKLRGGRRSYDPPAAGMIAAAAGLLLLLVGQYMHNSRQSLATYGFFNQTVGPVYRLFGSPVTPEWDIKGWQFEATTGNVDEGETTLTIVSRIANRSDQPLPYPLVHVSLTNRFEDIMGSRILEPGEYLANSLDPSREVPPGDSFDAVIAIEGPPPEATGFKLNVCYRAEPGTVRCAIEDFK